MADIDRQRRELMDQLGKEHEAVLGNADGQGVATLADLDRKIERALLGADGIRTRALADLDAIISGRCGALRWPLPS